MVRAEEPVTEAVPPIRYAKAGGVDIEQHDHCRRPDDDQHDAGVDRTGRWPGDLEPEPARRTGTARGAVHGVDLGTAV